MILAKPVALVPNYIDIVADLYHKEHVLNISVSFNSLITVLFIEY